MVVKDWDNRIVYKTLGASNHTEAERQVEDYYATEPKATKLLLSVEQFDQSILEPACGEGHMSRPIESAGYNVTSFDRVDRGYGAVQDFLNYKKWGGDIITNPPYKHAKEFVEHAMEIVEDGHKVAMFLKLTFLEGQGRREMFKKYPPRTVYVSSARLKCGKNGDFNSVGSSAIAYAWFVWVKGFKGHTVIRWIN